MGLCYETKTNLLVSFNVCKKKKSLLLIISTLQAWHLNEATTKDRTGAPGLLLRVEKVLIVTHLTLVAGAVTCIGSNFIPVVYSLGQQHHCR